MTDTRQGRNEFIKDFANGKKADLLAKMEENNGLLKAWEVLEQRSLLRVNSDLLNKIDDILKNDNIAFDKLKKTLENVFENRVPGWTSVENATRAIHSFRNHNNFEKVINGLASSGAKVRRGAGYVLNQADKTGAGLIDGFEHVYLIDSKFSADIIFKDGRKVDCKSWEVITAINKIPDFGISQQLKTYFKNPPFEMWFDFERFKEYPDFAQFTIDEAITLIKERYKTLFSSNNFEAYNDLAQSKYLSERLITNLTAFEIAVNNTNSAFYDFIKVK